VEERSRLDAVEHAEQNAEHVARRTVDLVSDDTTAEGTVALPGTDDSTIVPLPGTGCAGHPVTSDISRRHVFATDEAMRATGHVAVGKTCVRLASARRPVEDELGKPRLESVLDIDPTLWELEFC
jgi:hypothetical protein